MTLDSKITHHTAVSKSNMINHSLNRSAWTQTGLQESHSYANTASTPDRKKNHSRTEKYSTANHFLFNSAPNPQSPTPPPPSIYTPPPLSCSISAFYFSPIHSKSTTYCLGGRRRLTHHPILLSRKKQSDIFNKSNWTKLCTTSTSQ